MNPATAAVELQTALAALREGRPAEARAVAERALARDPVNADGWRIRGHACEAAGDSAAAIESFRKVRMLLPQSGLAALELGQALVRSGQAADALPELQWAASRLPREAQAHLALARAHFTLGRFREALTAFEDALALAPDDVGALQGRVVSYLRLGDVEQAVAAAHEAIGVHPQAPALQRSLATALSWTFERANLEEGLRWGQQALAAEPDHPGAHHTASILSRKLGDLTTAIGHAREALRRVPDNPDYAIALAEALELAGQAVDAERVLDRALAACPGSLMLCRQRGIVRLSAGNAAAAVADLRAVVASARSDQRAVAHLGAALAAAGRLDEALATVGLERNVHARELPVPEGFPDRAAFHRQLAHDIRNHSRQRWEPVGLAARQGYLSGDLLADRTPAIIGFEQVLRRTIDEFVAGLRPDPDDLFLRAIPRPPYRLHVWATRVGAGGNIDTHIHEDSWLSGAYYVELPPVLETEGDDPYAGWIEFGRPFRHLPAWPEDTLRRVRPQTGVLLLFPSFLFHRTLPFEGEGERISISFDLAEAGD